MPLANSYTDATVSATTHAAHHNAIAVRVNELDAFALPAGGRYTSAANRDVQIPTPYAGMLAHATDTGMLMYYAGVGWAPLAGTQVALLQAGSVQNVSATATAITLGTNVYLGPGQTRTANYDRYVLPYQGRYLVTASLSMAANSTGSYRYLYTTLNGLTTFVGGSMANLWQPGALAQAAGQSLGYFEANGTTDYVQMVMQSNHTGGGTLATTLLGASVPTMALTYLGPA